MNLLLRQLLEDNNLNIDGLRNMTGFMDDL